MKKPLILAILFIIPGIAAFHELGFNPNFQSRIISVICSEECKASDLSRSQWVSPGKPSRAISGQDIKTKQSYQGGDILLYVTRGTGTACCARRWGYDEDICSILAEEGFNVVAEDRGVIPKLSSAILANFNQFWLVSTETGQVFSTEEIQAIRNFHNSGKGIMIIGDSGVYDGPANAVAGVWGVSISGSYDHCGGTIGCPIDASEFAAHDIWLNVSSIQANLNEGMLSVSPPALAIADHNGVNMVAAYDVPEEGGRVVWDATLYRFTNADCHPDLSILHCDNAQYVRNVANWLATEPAGHAFVVYCGPSEIQGSQRNLVLGEADGKINAGDNINLGLPFKNIGNEMASDVTVQFLGHYAQSGEPAVLFYNGTDYSLMAEKLIVSLNEDMTTIIDNIWMHVGTVGVADLTGPSIHPKNTEFDIVVINNGLEEWTKVKLRIESVGFSGSSAQWALEGDCLRNPGDPEIIRYAQYAAGNAVRERSHSKDPDCIFNAASNIGKKVHEEFHPDYITFYTTGGRKEDVELIRRRNGNIGICYNYTDLMAGLLRSVGIPARALIGFCPGAGHAWNEILIDDQWLPIDATYNEYNPYLPGPYGNLGPILADAVTLPNASPVFVDMCVPECYLQAFKDCLTCKAIKFLFNCEGSCQVDVTDKYHPYGKQYECREDMPTRFSPEDLTISLSAPISVTQGIPFDLQIEVGNGGLDIGEDINIWIETKFSASDYDSIYTATPSYFFVDSLLPGNSLILESELVPLHYCDMMPLVVYMQCQDRLASTGLTQNINNPGTLQDLVLVTTVYPDCPVVDDMMDITAVVMDDSLEMVEDANVTAVVKSMGTEGFSDEVVLDYSAEDSVYSGSIYIPDDAPLGLYEIETVVAKTGYESDTTSKFTSIRGPIDIELSITGSTCEVTDTVLLYTIITYMDSAVIDAPVIGEMSIASDKSYVAFETDSVNSRYTAIITPLDFSINYGDSILPGGLWKLYVHAERYGAEACDSVEINVLVPDLSVSESDISIEPSIPSENDTVVISAVIKNIGSCVCDCARIRFMASMPDSGYIQAGTDQFLFNLQSDNMDTVEIEWVVIEGLRNCELIVSVDPSDFLVEIDKTNNIASKNFVVTQVENDQQPYITSYSLYQNCPNPFNPLTKIYYEIPRESNVNIKIYDVGGRFVRELVNDWRKPGKYEVIWDGRGKNGQMVKSGVYFYQLTAGEFKDTKKLVLLR